MQTVTVALWIVAMLVVVALIFDFMNGFHDAANSIATVVSTGVLKPLHAVMLAAFCNFIAIAIFELKVAATIGKGVVDIKVVDHYIVFGALIGAIGWNVITWYYGIPSSSSHALVGGIMGATIAKVGTTGLIGAGIWKIVLFIFLSPLIGFVLGAMLMVLVSWVFVRSRPAKVDSLFRRLQILSASLFSIGHGGNDAQKVIGIIWMLLISTGHATSDHVPAWVVISCYLTISLGTLFGGWRIVRTMGQKITKLKPMGGCCAETSGAMMLGIAGVAGIPVSTTHTITGAIVGVGSAKKFSAVRWGVAGSIVWAWIFTIPASAFMAAVAWWIGKQIL